MRRYHWLLWLMLALLPLRGWAFAVMTMPGAGGSDVATAVSADLPPCHQPAGLQGEHDQPAADGNGHTCALCEICHSAAVPVALLPVVEPAPAEATPAGGASASADAERQALFKPPRD